MQDVAAAGDVSPGLLYTYAAGKEALFSLVVQREVGVDVDALPLPVPNPDTKKLEALVRKSMRELVQSPAARRGRADGAAADARAELAAIVAEQYDGIHRARALRLVERCRAPIGPSSPTSSTAGCASRTCNDSAGTSRVRVASGDFRPVPDADVAAGLHPRDGRWFANHRYGDHDGVGIDDDIACATVVELVTNSLVAP